jgi:spore germination protein GerM
MVEPTGHCPYLGLKQNRAIRFASPTPEHRCYVGGEPIEIPVDQASYCLAQGHIHCPLYMGLSVPTTNDPEPMIVERAMVVPVSGVRGWLATLSRRDRTIYAIMLIMLAAIILIYLFAGLQAFFRPADALGGTTPTITTATAQPVSALPTGAATDVPSTPTDIATSTPSPRPTAEPTQQPLILLPTQVPPLPTASSTPITASISVTSTLPTTTSTAAQPTTAPSSVAATQVPAASTSTELVTLYFADATDRLYVPVQRRVTVENNQVALAAVRELIAGPHNGLKRLLLPDAHVLDLQISDGTATVNFDRRPSEVGNDRGLYTIALALTHISTIQRVQLQVNGQNIGVNGSGPIARPTLNPINPDNLPFDVHQTEFLPLYFVAADGQHDIRLIRMVPKTTQVAEGTVRALLDGPSGYSFAVQRVIPEATELRSIRLENGTIIVDFTQPFAQAANRAAAVRTVAESLTTLNTVNGVTFLVEGRSLGELWGQDYAGVFGRRPINLE